jgi:hypothetical protein
MCFAWISEKTAIFSVHSNNLSVFISEAECLLRVRNWAFKSDRYSFVLEGLIMKYQPCGKEAKDDSSKDF